MVPRINSGEPSGYILTIVEVYESVGFSLSYIGHLDQHKHKPQLQGTQSTPIDHEIDK